MSGSMAVRSAALEALGGESGVSHDLETLGEIGARNPGAR